MICLRCGYCCHRLFTIIVDDPSKGIVKGNLVTQYGTGTPCKHLEGERPGEYSCKIHNESWYPETPCFAHQQVESEEDSPCRMGKFIMGRK